MCPTEPEPSRTDESEPITTEAALRLLDDRSFVELVTKLWEQREWTVEEIRDHETWYVDFSLQRDWPVEQSGLLRIKRPDSETRVSGTEVRHFVRTVQKAPIDWSTLVLPREAPQSVRRRAAEFNVGVVDVDDLERLIHRRDAHGLLAAQVDRPLVIEADPIVARAPDPVANVLRRFDVIDRAEGLLDRRLPPNPTVEDLAGLAFTGFRVSLLFVAFVFLLTLAVPGGSISFWFLMGLFLFATYGVLLPLLAADVYFVRRFEDAPWTPTWWLFVSFMFAPVFFIVGSVYWVRRRQRTPSGRKAAWWASETGADLGSNSGQGSASEGDSESDTDADSDSNRHEIS